MTLKNIPLTPGAVADLYKYSLVAAQNFLGGNNKNILVLVNNVDSPFLPYGQLTFLSGILSACKLRIDDIAIVNLNNQNTSNLISVADILKPAIIIACGIELSELALPFKIPPFQVQLYNGKKYVLIPSLQIIESDAGQKRKLWELLKVLFSI